MEQTMITKKENVNIFEINEQKSLDVIDKKIKDIDMNSPTPKEKEDL